VRERDVSEVEEKGAGDASRPKRGTSASGVKEITNRRDSGLYHRKGKRLHSKKRKGRRDRRKEKKKSNCEKGLLKRAAYVPHKKNRWPWV